MKKLLTLVAGISLLIPQVASAEPRDKDQKVPPGQARKAAAATASQAQPTVTRSATSRDYIAPTVRSTTSSRDGDSYRSSRNYNSGDRYRTSRSYDSGDRYRTSRTYDSGDRYRSSRSYDSGDRYRSSYRYARPSVDIYRNWNRGRIYSWNNNRYHWHGGSWVIYDASPRVVYTERSVGGSVVANVQAELRRRGYDAGPADGVMGGRTRAAIIAFQADRGLSRTGRINESLLRALNLT